MTIWEPDIRKLHDGATCRPPFGDGFYWQIQRIGFMPGVEDAWDNATTRATINRKALLDFSHHRGPCTLMGVSLDCKTLQSFVEHLEGDELEARALRMSPDRGGMLLVRQGAGFGGIYELTLPDDDLPASFELKYSERQIESLTRYREDIADADNREDFALWAEACARGKGKVPHIRDFDRDAECQERNPIFGAPVPLLWFDEDGNGPNIIEVSVDGFDFVPKGEERKISARVGLSLPDTKLTGGGSFNIRSLTDLIDNLTAAREWMRERLVVAGCECGICSPHSKQETWCDAARATHEAASEPHETAIDGAASEA